MKVTSTFIKRLQLDEVYGLLSARHTQMIYELFKLLDTRHQDGLDDIQFKAFMSTATDLNAKSIDKIFDIFDLDRSGSVDFGEFFLLICILVSIKDNHPKQFLFRNWRTCFELLDEDGSKSVSRGEFETLGFLFNFSRNAVKKIYDVFDVSGNSELDYNEFQLFVFAAIDVQADLEREVKKTASRSWSEWVETLARRGGKVGPEPAELGEAIAAPVTAAAVNPSITGNAPPVMMSQEMLEAEFSPQVKYRKKQRLRGISSNWFGNVWDLWMWIRTQFQRDGVPSDVEKAGDVGGPETQQFVSGYMSGFIGPAPTLPEEDIKAKPLF